MLSSDSVYLCPFTRTNNHKKAVIKNQCNLGTRMMKFENAGLRDPLKISLGSGLHSQKVSGLQSVKWSGSGLHSRNFRAPGLQGPPLWDPDLKTQLFFKRNFPIHNRVSPIQKIQQSWQIKQSTCCKFRSWQRTISGMHMRSKNTSGLPHFLPVYKKPYNNRGFCVEFNFFDDRLFKLWLQIKLWFHLTELYRFKQIMSTSKPKPGF